MRIGLWSDSHYSTAEITCHKRYNSASLEKIRRALARFKAEKCDLVICLGDLIDREASHEQEKTNLCLVADVLDEAALPFISLMGNHDAFAFTPEEFYALLGTDRAPRLIQQNGRNLLFIDACYFRTGVHYALGDSDWTDTFYPHTESLVETLRGLTGDTYVFMHQNIDAGIRADHCLANAEEMRRILEESGTVRAIYQGHYHPGFASEHAGIPYTTLPAMCENDDATCIIDI